ncbi:hypothetical protein EVAR_44915_1 [Eumeta japonica]|uniref:Uncharacterized protein n=1 Tax=Eumeta variegata TaxID=151549 RepID=A0A4C1XKY8_EUMVA|nr:hypothetical protein EVAR_44915_1 [Eumeta japonica]
MRRTRSTRRKIQKRLTTSYRWSGEGKKLLEDAHQGARPPQPAVREARACCFRDRDDARRNAAPPRQDCRRRDCGRRATSDHSP